MSIERLTKGNNISKWISIPDNFKQFYSLWIWAILAIWINNSAFAEEHWKKNNYNFQASTSLEKSHNYWIIPWFSLELEKWNCWLWTEIKYWKKQQGISWTWNCELNWLEIETTVWAMKAKEWEKYVKQGLLWFQVSSNLNENIKMWGFVEWTYTKSTILWEDKQCETEWEEIKCNSEIKKWNWWVNINIWAIIDWKATENNKLSLEWWPSYSNFNKKNGFWFNYSADLVNNSLFDWNLTVIVWTEWEIVGNYKVKEYIAGIKYKVHDHINLWANYSQVNSSYWYKDNVSWWSITICFPERCNWREWEKVHFTKMAWEMPLWFEWK